jgi:CDP-paratose 2-epimerase
LDLLPLVERQLVCSDKRVPRIVNAGGGRRSARSLRQVSEWCRERLGNHDVESTDQTRLFDLPWVVLDVNLANQVWGWTPSRTTESILDEILEHAQQHPDWLDLSAET